MLNKATLLTQGLYANFGSVDTSAEENARKNAVEQAGKVTVDSNGNASASSTGTNSGKRRGNTTAKISNSDNIGEPLDEDQYRTLTGNEEGDRQASEAFKLAAAY